MKILEIIKQYIIPIVVFLFTVGVISANYNYKIETLVEASESSKNRITELEKAYIETSNAITRIEVKLENIEYSVKEIKLDIKEIKK